ncbi:hypothetical protein DXG03_003053 [Asterophora parasitica]|uniref:Uncharacterized protein n=1 Tax=Asterophora parasitica TaxID=117018 RepID=A0A9P7G3C9_9AGAR|nr:hypothetical protein DXG03_003053 [Asterophora parasitica]
MSAMPEHSPVTNPGPATDPALPALPPTPRRKRGIIHVFGWAGTLEDLCHWGEERQIDGCFKSERGLDALLEIQMRLPKGHQNQGRVWHDVLPNRKMLCFYITSNSAKDVKLAHSPELVEQFSAVFGRDNLKWYEYAGT